MTGESTNSQKLMLAAAIAEGTAIAKWAASDRVPERTAYRWAAEPEVRSAPRSVTWPSGTRAVCLSGEEPERARGFTLNFDNDRRVPPC
jgi:hypothetical protein